MKPQNTNGTENMGTRLVSHLKSLQCDDPTARFMNGIEDFAKSIAPVMRNVLDLDLTEKSKLDEACKTFKAALAEEQELPFLEIEDLQDWQIREQSYLHFLAGLFAAFRYLNYSVSEIMEIFKFLMTHGIKESLKTAVL